ncbi:helix-turn-helix transcriptional regulator [Halobaculum limi]|uniref:helix-turn-helix transcriptional regulator n=1 Tax=Halobaculum limi TaxID=3031916 RepID=UPI002406B5DC|nr:helix-turn-helix domain-containing protein [Halobaculum sp. YSMS11]
MTGDHHTETDPDQHDVSTTPDATAQDDAFADLPPSAKLVHFVLDRDEQHTQTELVEETALSARTVRTALGRLEEAGLVSESICLRDARKRLYSLTDDADPSADVTAEAQA